MVRSITHSLGLAAIASLALLMACGSSSATSVGAGTATAIPCPQTTSLNGAGATFPFPLYSKMFTEYAKARCQVQVNYQSVGSGQGISNLLKNVVDFGATDSPMKDTDLASSTNGPILHVPATLGSEAMIYNVKGIDTGLKLTGTIIANIYLGTVTKWNDPSIVAVNPGLTLPAEAIAVVHRSDGSGTTGIFSKYLSVVSADWSTKVGFGTTVNWPVGLGGKGNEGVATTVKSTEGGIGYVELAYVVANKFNYAAVQNADASAFLSPSIETTKAAAAAVKEIPTDLRFFTVNQPGKDAYPIAGFSWIIVYQNQKDADKGQAVANLLWYMIHDGQAFASALTYAPLPDLMVQKSEAQIKAIMCNGSPCYKG